MLVIFVIYFLGTKFFVSFINSIWNSSHILQSTLNHALVKGKKVFWSLGVRYIDWFVTTCIIVNMSAPYFIMIVLIGGVRHSQEYFTDATTASIMEVLSTELLAP